MSLPVFISKLSEEDLDEVRLREVWNECNLKNKSNHIDQLLKALYKHVSGGRSLTKNNVVALCEKYKNIVIKNSIPSTKPALEEEDGHMINPATSIVFEKEGDDLIAVGVYSMGKVYPLQRKHFNICITNGWYFRTEDPDISCPFKK